MLLSHDGHLRLIHENVIDVLDLQPGFTIAFKGFYPTQHPFEERIRCRKVTYHCRVRIEAACNSIAPLKKAIPWTSRNNDLICADE